MIEKFACRDFTALGRVNVTFSPGVNVIIGENGIGKTHLMTASYALASSGALKREGSAPFASQMEALLVDLFRPLDDDISNLRKHGAEGRVVIAADFSSGRRVSALIGSEDEQLIIHDDNFPKTFTDDPVFIPARETVSFLKGFAALCARYEMPFDRRYRSLALALDLPKVRGGKVDDSPKRIIAAIERVCGGRFDFRGGGIVTYVSGGGEQSAGATSEGLLQFAVLSRLLENGTIRPGESGPLFWDHPETNMNPKLLKVLAGMILELARNGQQVILSTHSYVLLKYLDLLADRAAGDDIRFHSLAHDAEGAVRLESADRFDRLGMNSIIEAYFNLYDTELDRRSAGERL